MAAEGETTSTTAEAENLLVILAYSVKYYKVSVYETVKAFYINNFVMQDHFILQYFFRYCGSKRFVYFLQSSPNAYFLTPFCPSSVELTFTKIITKAQVLGRLKDCKYDS